MQVEALIIAIVVAVALTVWARTRTKNTVVSDKQGAADMRTPQAGAEQITAAANPAVRRVLKLEETEPFEGSLGFLKGFGINPSSVGDLRLFRGTGLGLDSFPERVRKCLTTSYQAGLGRGLEVPALLTGTRPLASDEAVYFALVERPQSAGAIVTFIDKVR